MIEQPGPTLAPGDPQEWRRSATRYGIRYGRHTLLSKPGGVMLVSSTRHGVQRKTPKSSLASPAGQNIARS